MRTHIKLEALRPKEPETDDHDQVGRGGREDQIDAPAERLQHFGEDNAQAPGADEVKHQFDARNSISVAFRPWLTWRDVVRKTRLIFDGQSYTTVSLCLNLPNQNQSKLTKSCRCSPLVDLNYRNLNFHIFLENRSLGRQLVAPKCLVCFCGVALSRNRSAHYIELPAQFIDLGLFSCRLDRIPRARACP
jgi:hypothetical protein